MSSTTCMILANTVSGHRILKIENYSSTKSALPNGAGKRLLSAPFTVGGHIWRIAYYPNGIDTRQLRSTPCISLYLVLDERVPRKLVKARFHFRFAPPAADQERRHGPASCFPAKKKKKKSRPEAHFDSGEVLFASHGIHGCEEFIKKKELEKSVFLQDDSFAIWCGITVFDGSGAEPAAAAPRPVSVLPPDLGQNLSDLLGAKMGADVKFKVGGKTFAAHRCLLAARSPVFAAELFGSMRESRKDEGGVIRVADMEERVFEALLQFLYTDSWAEMAVEDECTMAQHLLVAADRYGMERLKSICEYKLCSYIGVGTAANILALAELHHCEGLKGACVSFLKFPGNLTAAMAGGDFEHLSRSCPVVAQELIASCGTSSLIIG
uniref:Uncharacterized protein n=1 Tax=Avena sativa TaxID=4498 RepID=A0ACD5T7G1_AVESA